MKSNEKYNTETPCWGDAATSRTAESKKQISHHTASLVVATVAGARGRGCDSTERKETTRKNNKKQQKKHSASADSGSMCGDEYEGDE
jgi:hypothetical protein